MSVEIKKTFHKDGALQIICYYENGDLHREDGPAYETYFSNGQLLNASYWLKGNFFYSEKEYYRHVALLNLSRQTKTDTNLSL